MKPTTLREHVIVMSERQEAQMKLLETHIKESNEYHERVLGTLQNHNDRIIKIEEKSRPPFLKLLSRIGAFFGLGG